MEWVKRCKLKNEMEKMMERKQRPNRRSDSTLSYESLERGALSPQDARKFVAQILEAEANDEIGESLYESLRILLGRMLRDKSQSEDLRAWHSLIDATSAQFDEVEEPWAARIEVLAELLSDRIGLLESRPVHEVVQRRHVPELLELLDDRRGDWVKRSELRDHLGLEEANLSRILTLLVDTGLIERSRAGKEALFAISSIGSEALRDLNDRVGLRIEVRGSWEEMFDYEPRFVEQNGGITEFVDIFEPEEPLAA